VKRRRPTPSRYPQVGEADRLLSRGPSGPRGGQGARIWEPTFHRWRAQYGGMKADDAKRLRELERENARLKRIVADQTLDIGLKEIARGNW
jgi:putative transposase